MVLFLVLIKDWNLGFLQFAVWFMKKMMIREDNKMTMGSYSSVGFDFIKLDSVRFSFGVKLFFFPASRMKHLYSGICTVAAWRLITVISLFFVMIFRRFSHGNLAQLKYILPEAIVIKKVLMLDERTSCMKPDLLITLDVDGIENSKLESGNSHLRKIFRARLLDFAKAHPEVWAFSNFCISCWVFHFFVQCFHSAKPFSGFIFGSIFSCLSCSHFTEQCYFCI